MGVEEMAEKGFVCLESIINSMENSGIICVTFDGRQAMLRYASNSYFRMLGYGTADDCPAICQGLLAEAGIHPEDIPTLLAQLREQLNQHSHSRLTHKLRAIAKDGGLRWIMASGVVIGEAAGLCHIQYIVTDITELHETMAELDAEREKMHLLAGISAENVFEYDIAAKRIASKSDTPFPYFGTMTVDNYRERCLSCQVVHPEDRQAFVRFCDEMDSGQGEIRSEFRHLMDDGRYHWYSVQGRTFYDQAGHPLGVIGKTAVIDEKKTAEADLVARAERDPLTGLYNHPAAKAIISDYLAQHGGTLLVIDIDDFKEANDTHGHIQGDRVLNTVASAMRRTFRSDDVLSRFGGDEFVAFLKEATGGIGCGKGKALQQNIQAQAAEMALPHPIKISVGVAQSRPGESYDQLFSRADKALYHVKKHGKAACELYESEEKYTDSAICCP